MGGTGKVLTTILPTLLIIGLGWWLTKRRFLTVDFVDGLFKLVYWVALPCLIIDSVTKADVKWAAAGQTLLVFFLASGLTLTFSLLLVRTMKMPKALLGSFLQTVFRGNVALIGLPILIMATDPAEAPRVAALAVLIMAPIMLSFNIMSVVVLTLTHPTVSAQTIRASMWGLRSNPLILAALCGIALAWMGLPLPTPLARAVGVVGNISSPLALLCIGAGLQVSGWMQSTQRHWPILATALKTILLPTMACGLGRWMGLPPEEMRILMYFTATPVAAASLIMAKQLGGDTAFTAQTIALSTLFSAVSLSVVVAIWG